MPSAVEISARLSSVGYDPLVSRRRREVGVHTYRALSLLLCTARSAPVPGSPALPQAVLGAKTVGKTALVFLALVNRLYPPFLFL